MPVFFDKAVRILCCDCAQLLSNAFVCFGCEEKRTQVATALSAPLRQGVAKLLDKAFVCFFQTNLSRRELLP